MVGRVVVPRGTPLHDTLSQTAADQRIAFLAGLSGVGKSFLLQQLAILAHQAGRTVHLLQWDVCREAFETPEILRRYPEVDGATHMTIRMAVGLWVRDGVRQWHEAHPDRAHMLIGEPPLAGHRLIELAQQKDDEAEALLSGPESRFLVPVPSREVRATIEAARGRSIANPRHDRESADAPPNVMQDDWREIWLRSQQIRRVQASGDAPSFDPEAYADVYRHLLRHRRTTFVPVDLVLTPTGSVYDLHVVASELAASPTEVQRCMEQAESSQVTGGEAGQVGEEGK